MVNLQGLMMLAGLGAGVIFGLAFGSRWGILGALAGGAGGLFLGPLAGLLYAEAIDAGSMWCARVAERNRPVGAALALAMYLLLLGGSLAVARAAVGALRGSPPARRSSGDRSATPTMQRSVEGRLEYERCGTLWRRS